MQACIRCAHIRGTALLCAVAVVCCALMCHHLDGKSCPKHELPWLRLLHHLLECTTQTTCKGPNTRPAAWASFVASLQQVARPHEHYATYKDGLLQPLADPARAASYILWIVYICKKV